MGRTLSTPVETEIESLLDGCEPICEEAVRVLTHSRNQYYPTTKAVTIRGSRIHSGMDRPISLRGGREIAHMSLVSGWQLGIQPFILSNQGELLFTYEGVQHPKFNKKLPFASPATSDNSSAVAFFLSRETVRNVIDELANFVHP